MPSFSNTISDKRIGQSGLLGEYQFTTLSTKKSNIIKVVFDQSYANGGLDVKTAYSPTSSTGFASNYYDGTTSPYIVKQLDKYGNVVAAGILLRYIPSDNKQTMFIQTLPGYSGTFDPQNGVIFGNTKNLYGSYVSGGNTFSYGTSISEINLLNNVVKLTAYFTDGQDIPNSAGQIDGIADLDFGSFIPGNYVRLKRKASASSSSLESWGFSPGASGQYAYGKILSVSVGTGSISLIVSGMNINQSLVTGAGQQPYYFEDAQTNPTCARYQLDAVTVLSTPSTNIQEIVFNDTNTAGLFNYQLFVQDADNYVYQYRWDNTIYNTVTAKETASTEQGTIKGQVISWDSINRKLYVITTRALFDAKYGTVYQSTAGSTDRFYGGNGYDNILSNFTERTGAFINIAQTYDPTNIGDFVIGRDAVQPLSTGSTTNSWNSDQDYIENEEVRQWVGASSYIPFKVVKWDKPKTFAESLISPAKLVIKYRNVNAGRLSVNSSAFKKLLPARIPYASANTWKYALDTTVITGLEIDKNTSQILDTENYLPLVQTDSRFFEAGPRVYENGVKLGSCAIRNIAPAESNTIFNNYSLIKLSLFNIQPEKLFTFNDIKETAIRLAYESNTIFKSHPATCELNTLRFEITASDTQPASSRFKEKDILVGLDGQTSTVVSVSADRVIIRRKTYDEIFTVGTVIANVIRNGVTIDTADVAVLECLPYGNINFINANNNGLVYPLQNGIYFDQIQQLNLNTTIIISKSIYSYWNPAQTTTTISSQEFGDMALVSNSSTLYYKDTAGNIKTTTTGISYNSTTKTITITKPSDLNTNTLNFMLFGTFTGSLGTNYRIKNLEATVTPETRNLKWDDVGKVWYCYLTRADVTGLDSIVYTDGTTTTGNMASLFKLDSGERNDIYDFAAITFKKDAVKTFFNFAGLNELALRDSKTGIPLQISYTYFEHKNSNEKASGPIIKESYRYGDNSFMDINDIGVYTLNGVQHHKSALIDFRPIVVLVDPISSEIDPVNGNTELKFNFLPSTLSPISGSFYVGRVDNLYLDKSGRYVVVEGSPEINPVPPSKNVTNGMLLYKIFVPPLTPDIRRVSFERVENKRYTMRDIGKLEERIKNLEYYTSLSLLEKDVQSLMVKDADGNTREKNGFIVDTFSNHSVGNVFNNDYNIAVDPTEQAARHPFKTTRLDLELLEAKDFKETDYKQLANNFTLTTNEPTGLYIIKPEAIEPFIVQPVATTEESVTPFDVTVFDGKIYLSPEVDDWIDYKQLPAVKSNLPGERDNWEFMAQLLTNNNIAPFGTVYGEWRTTSVDKSSERTGRPQCDIDLLSTTVSDARITSGAGFDEWWSREQQRLGRLPDEGLVGADVNVRNTVIGTLNANRVWADVRTTQREYERDCVVAVKDTTTTNQIRDTKTLQAKVFEQENIVDLGSKVVDMAVSHYIRPQTISIYVVGLKPKTKFNVFFDGVSVNEFCRIYDPSNPSATISFNQGTVKTDEKGSARILFDVPSGKFRTGDRVIVITDNDTPNIEDFATKMYATKVFGASGLTVTKQSTELLVRTYDFVPGDTIRGTENRQLVDETTRIERDINRFFTVDRDVIPGPPRRTRDPLAQTFFVNEEEYPNGLYVDSVDLCFGTKDTVRPVYVELRPVVNGLPDAERIYPQATAVLPPEKINAVNDLNLLPSLSDSRSYTRFEFGTPIYLPPGQHSLVVRTDITSYTVFTAKLGENDLATGKKVQGQEYVGVFFRSANLSTWQPDGTTDLMFRMNKCVFDTDASPTNPITKTIDFTVDTDRDFNNTFEVDPNYLTYQLYNLALNYSNPNNVCEITFDIENVTKTNEQESNEVAANTDITLNRSFNLYKTDTITNRRFKMTINATIKDKHISPIFDIQKSGVCFVRNMIDETEIGLDGVVKTEMVTNELKPLADLKDSTLNGVQPATCRYITRSVILNKGFDATNCRLLITAVKPKGTDILAFIKMKSALSKERFEDSSYVQMNYVGSQFTSINNEDYREMEFEMPEDVTEFNEFQIKLCLFSNDSAVTPKIKNLRGIAII